VTAVFSSEDGRLSAVLDIAGALAVDPSRGKLFVERAAGGAVGHYGAPDDPRPMIEPGERELVTVNVSDGSVIGTVPLPPASRPLLLDGSAPAPLVDTNSGDVLVFREHRVVRVDPQTGDVRRDFETGVVYAENDPRAGEGPVPIRRAFIDPASWLLYLQYVTLESSPWSGHTIVSHHLDSLEARGRGDYSTATYPIAAGGRLFGQLWNRSGFTSAWQWRDGAPFSTRMGPPDPPIGTAVDLETERMFAANTTHLRVLDTDTMLPQRTLPHGLQDATEVSLAGFDTASGHLVFVADGDLRLLRWPE
jgi:hypothetical protein